MNVYDIVNSINRGEKIELNADTEKMYVPFIINRTLSYFPDTVLAANEMNMYPDIDKNLQYDFLINIVRPAKRFAKWVKRVDSKEFEAVQQYFKFNDMRTLEVLQILSDEDIKTIRQALDPGG